MIKLGQMVLKGVIWVHNTKSGHMVLKGVNWVHLDKIRSNLILVFHRKDPYLVIDLSQKPCFCNFSENACFFI